MIAIRSAALALWAVPSAMSPAMAAIVVRRVNFIFSSLGLLDEFLLRCGIALSDPPDAFGDLGGLENFLPVGTHEGGLAELDGLVAGIGKDALDFLEDHRPQHIHVAKQKIACRFRWNAAADHFIHRFAHDIEKGCTNSLREARLK